MPTLPLGSIIAFDFKSWDIREEIALLHEVGIGRVQIYRNYVEAHDPHEIRETLDAEGFAIDSLHGYFWHEDFQGPPCDLSAADADLRGKSLKIMRGEARFARALACRDIIVHPAGPGKTEEDPWRSAALQESAAALASIAAEFDVRFLIENMPNTMFGRDAAGLRRIVDAVASPGIGLAYDSGHAMLANDPVGTIHAMGPRLWGVHINDNRGTVDDHFIPGMGVIPFEDVARALAAVKFAGTFLIEVYRSTAEVRRDLTPERFAHILRLRRIASGLAAG